MSSITIQLHYIVIMYYIISHFYVRYFIRYSCSFKTIAMIIFNDVIVKKNHLLQIKFHNFSCGIPFINIFFYYLIFFHKRT